MKGLEGKRVVVTGGTSGIGEATSRRFLDEGAWVVALAFGEEEVATAAQRRREPRQPLRCSGDLLLADGEGDDARPLVEEAPARRLADAARAARDDDALALEASHRATI